MKLPRCPLLSLNNCIYEPHFSPLKFSGTFCISALRVKSESETWGDIERETIQRERERQEDAHRWRGQRSGEQGQGKGGVGCMCWSRGLKMTEDRDIRMLMTAWFLGGRLCVLLLNINSSHLSVPMPTMNNRGSTQLCQHSELLISQPQTCISAQCGALHSAGCGHNCLLRLSHMRALSHRKWDFVCIHIFSDI